MKAMRWNVWLMLPVLLLAGVALADDKPAKAPAADTKAPAADKGDKADKAAKADEPADKDTWDNPFAGAIAYAQKRTVKLIGGGIGREHGYATGLIVSPDGHILTAHGVYVSDARTPIQIVMPDGRVYPATVERRSDRLQAVLLKIDAKTPNYFELPGEPIVKKGDWVLGVSNVFKVADRNEPLSVNMGIVSLRTKIDAKKRALDIDVEGELLLIDAITSNPGAPGGALMTADKKLAGMIGKIIESRSTNTRLNYAIPSDRLKPFVEGKDEPVVVAPASAGKPYLGLRLLRLTGKRAPAYIDRIVPGSPAAKAGLHGDDLLLAINGQVVRSVSGYDDIFKGLRVGQEITIIYKRKSDVLSTRLIVAPEKTDD